MTDADVNLLAGAVEQIYELNIAGAQLTQDGMQILSQLKNLSKLHLENSSVTDDDVEDFEHSAAIAVPESLQYPKSLTQAFSI